MRISKVDDINIHALSFSSHLTIGDSAYINAKARALAVKREYPLFYGNEGNFLAFSLFTKPIPQPVITENVRMTVENPNSDIVVNTVNIKGISSSSVFQVGANKQIQADSRIKHIRQLLSSGEQ
ncbi:spore germination protein GerPE [Sutcliffiella cohnii]|uniref:Spore germination protein GerPE n=1 Tax=Sutcliffiella cohnii TaxID=33932 RepID=A0A223KM30_9BACI|nr:MULTISPECIES: spore germination protein GerPE [Sutcliffiella]AST90545.1 hypothetical protein BC6307_04260 [Sutcliffiella cohnii]MED4016828.1 spore germination protein GerPE [Sutcliffiella cohnii]WBL16195.1 spore germination protein GerPE [Sutcliffiella sp. NC1]